MVDWISSLGGPLVLIAKSDCVAWQGAPTNYPAEEGDYGLACAVDDYIGLVEFRGHQALVLGEEPARTTFLAQYSLLVRAVSAEPGTDIESTVATALPDISWETELTWDFAGPLVLFDSSATGAEALAGEHLIVDLESGRYSAKACYVSLPGLEVILVRLESQGKAT